MKWLLFYAIAGELYCLWQLQHAETTRATVMREIHRSRRVNGALWLSQRQMFVWSLIVSVVIMVLFWMILLSGAVVGKVRRR